MRVFTGTTYWIDNGAFYTLGLVRDPEINVFFQGDDAVDFESVFDAACGVEEACSDFDHLLVEAEQDLINPYRNLPDRLPVFEDR